MPAIDYTTSDHLAEWRYATEPLNNIIYIINLLYSQRNPGSRPIYGKLLAFIALGSDCGLAKVIGLGVLRPRERVVAIRER